MCAKASTGPPGSRARCVRVCSGSQTAQGWRPSCDGDGLHVAFRSFRRRRHPGGEEAFAAQYPAHSCPCQRFAVVLAGERRMTRSRCGSLNLHRSALSSVTSRRFFRRTENGLVSWLVGNLASSSVDLPTYQLPNLPTSAAVYQNVSGERMTGSPSPRRARSILTAS